ncbi:MAG: Maf family protein [Armatimonadota bacterium]|nr:Maf family protein [Armatimonadota bacterium]
MVRGRKVILASASPRRRELLELIYPTFEIVPSDFDEDNVSTELPPAEYVVRAAAQKARAVAEGQKDAIVIGADTIVVVDGRILGKPTDVQDARRMLRLLAGRTHQVYTGVCVISVQKGKPSEAEGVERTGVTVRALTDELIERYIGTGEPMDKAGAYAIQGKGAVLIQRVDGCYFNVVGLPVYLLSTLLEDLGMELFG